MNINLDLSDFWLGVSVEKLAKHYSAKFVCETPIKNNSGWRDASSLIFYNKEPHPDGSNYFAIPVNPDGDFVISDGISATNGDFVGVVDGDDIIYSRFRHDYRVGKTGVMIDGGRDYIRSSVCDPDLYQTLEIVDGVLRIKDE